MHDHVHRQKLDLTRNQALVFDALAAADGPLTAYAILDALRDEGMRAPLQVYRALTKLMNVGLVHRLESLNAFVVCSHPGCASHDTAAFAICETCGQVDEFAPDTAIGLLQDWAREHSFALARTTVELRGECQRCQKAR
ncbi:Fur family transcriptional regulator [Roseibium aestuarii]|uniref:Fur family transcriptional regulator n=1 Tax=Roseibium aestuarii TaxID=2600299 RepID=A0ABW4JSD3_9HYPH|nr:Fur family transcriptional regulator [Roseibium aestuarii]